MTDASRSLLRLAALAGVGTAYRDAWDKPRRIAPDTLRAVLGAMGIAAGNAAEIKDGIAALEAEDWRPLLPPVAVVLEQDPAAPVPLTVPERLCGGRVLWSVVCEDGTRRDGAAELGTLAILAQRGSGKDRRRRFALPVDPSLPLGYHRLAVAVGDENAETSLIVAPRCCHLPPEFEPGGRCWGLTAQLYSVRSERNWGIGDFTDLQALAELAAARGAGVLGLNPLHALFPAEPRHISPYAPSSRKFLNPLYLDVQAVPDFADSAAAKDRVAAPEFKAMLARARASDLVDYPTVAALKQPIFEVLHQSFAERHLGAGPDAARTERGAAFRRFQRDGGTMLEAFATFTALHGHFWRASGTFSWTEWPADFRDAGSEAVRRFAAEHRVAVERHQYLQWEADRQLAAAAAHAASSGLRVGLYRDLAVGVDPNGAEAWADPSLLATGASVGAPPDHLNLKGQDWGLAPVNPVALRRQAYAPFIAALRANMRHAGVLRIDHVMALKHLYWVPRGATPAAGAYVAYPFDDLRRILALESQRHACAVIGEDLGTVPEGFRETLQDAGALSYRVLLFERDAQGGLLPPDAYPPLAAASFSTHDIATLKGFWLGRDLEWRRALDLYPEAGAAAEDERARRRDRRLLLRALIGAGVLPEVAARQLLPEEEAPVYTPELAAAVHRYLGRTASRLALLQIEDAIGAFEQANLPGTVDEHPNWRRKLGLALEEMRRDPMFLRQTAAIDEARARQEAVP